MKHLFLSSSILVLGIVGAFVSATVAEAATDIHCGYILDVEAEKLLVNQHILIEDGYISAIGSSVNAPAGVDEIDLSDSYCAPGLLDAHAHLFLDLTTKTLDQIAPTQSSAYNALVGLKNAQKLLSSGFTPIT